jgi:beta-glucosidase
MKLAPPLCLALVLTCAAARAQAPMPADERAIWDTEFAWNKAYVDGDAAKLASIEDKAYVYTDGDGTVHTKADEQAEALAGKMHFTEMSLHEAVVRISGDTAIVTGRLVVSGGLKETFGEIDESTDTLVLRDGAWKALASADVLLAPTAESSVFPIWREGGWLRRHEQFVEQARKGNIDLLFVGDSITDFWRSRGKAVWDKYYGNLRAANFGISADRTQHVLWRLDNGEIDGLKPKAVVLMIGTNNTGFERDGLTPRNTPEQAADGVKAVVADLRKRLPDSKILLLAVFPRSHLPTDPARLQVQEINRRIAGLGDGDHVRYLDIGDRFLTKDGVLEKDIMPDYLHPSVRGYEIWAQAIQQPLSEMLGSAP